MFMEASGEDKEDMCTKKDLISRFPEAILSHILSFLTTKEAVGTSILSKQWRYLWTSVPVVYIHDQDLLYPFKKGFENPPQDRRPLFMDFVDTVLLLDGNGGVVSCLRVFYLSCYFRYDSSRVNAWIRAVIARSRNVEHLQLRFCKQQRFKLSPVIFTTCNKLVCLKLTEVAILNVPASTHLPNLKILHLYKGALCNEVSLKNLLAGCPILEDLNIETDVCPDIIDTLFVRSSSLKRLKFGSHGAWFNGRRSFGIVVDAINLKTLDLNICDLRQTCELNSLYGLSSLIEVKLDLYEPVSDSESIEAGKLVELLRKMSNTEYMSLSINIMKSLGHTRLNKLPMFLNLTRLQLRIDQCSWHALSYLFECTPNLITSSFYMVPASLGDPGEQRQKFRTPKRLMLNLEEIEIRSFEGCANGMKMVRYFLKKAPVLKKISILYLGSKREKILKKLSTFPKTSTTCQIAFF